MNARANYVGKKSAFLDSPRSFSEFNIGVPNYWAFKQLQDELAKVKEELNFTKDELAESKEKLSFTESHLHFVKRLLQSQEEIKQDLVEEELKEHPPEDKQREAPAKINEEV